MSNTGTKQPKTHVISLCVSLALAFVFLFPSQKMTNLAKISYAVSTSPL